MPELIRRDEIPIFYLTAHAFDNIIDHAGMLFRDLLHIHCAHGKHLAPLHTGDRREARELVSIGKTAQQMPMWIDVRLFEEGEEPQKLIIVLEPFGSVEFAVDTSIPAFQPVLHHIKRHITRIRCQRDEMGKRELLIQPDANGLPTNCFD